MDIDVANVADPDRTERIEVLVDSGAIDTVVPEAVLARLGIQRLTERVFRLSNGDKIRRRYGERIGGADVIFGEEGDVNLLGVATLESLGHGLDPIKREPGAPHAPRSAFLTPHLAVHVPSPALRQVESYPLHAPPRPCYHSLACPRGPREHAVGYSPL